MPYSTGRARRAALAAANGAAAALIALAFGPAGGLAAALALAIPAFAARRLA